MSAIFAGSSLRVDVAGVPAIENLTFESKGRCILVLGAPYALFDAAAGLRDLARGTLLVGGHEPELALRLGISAAVPLDPPLPPRWTVFDYIAWGARLSGLSGSRCGDAIEATIDRLKLHAERSTRLGKAPLGVRRGAVLGAALAAEPQVLLLEDPMSGLADEEDACARVLAQARQDKNAVFFCGRVSLRSAIALGADEALVIEGSHVAAQGAPIEIAAKATSFVVQVLGGRRALVDTLVSKGCRIQGSDSTAEDGRFTVDLGELRTSDLLRFAEASSATVLELRPLARVFA